MNNKHLFRYIIYILVIIALSSCNFRSRNSNEWKDPELVEMQDSDRSVQYYLPFSVEALATGRPLTTNDLQTSGRLLLTSSEHVKAIRFSDRN